MSDDKRPKRAALPVPPHQGRRKKRKIDVNPEEQILSEILSSQVATSGEPTNLEQCVEDTVGPTKSQSVDSTLLSQSEYSLPALASCTESSHHTSKPTCKCNFIREVLTIICES